MENNNGLGSFYKENKFQFSVNGVIEPMGFSISLGNSSSSPYDSGFYDTEKHNVILDNGCGVLLPSVTLDGNKLHEFDITGELTGGFSITLFARQVASGFRPSKYKIYSSKIYEGDVLVQDLIPIRKDGKGYMYDKISKKLFSNGGTGEFIIGADKGYWGLKFTAEEAGSTISMTNFETPNPITLLTSTDGNTWTQFTPNETTITLTNVSDYIYFKAGEGGNTCFGLVVDDNSIGDWEFVMTGKISASGNIMSLLNGEQLIYEMTNDNAGAFACLFYGCTALTKAPDLPATELAVACYQFMFYGCTALTQAPDLPATELVTNCYDHMFSGCTALTQAPELPATTLTGKCYQNMFNGCLNLSSINVSFTEWNPTTATINWLSNVKSTGTFICPSELQEVRGVSYIPEGWTIERKHSARSYIQDGLIAMWDGKENTAFGVHNPNATVWTDIVGGKIASPKQTGNNPIWGTNGFTGDGVNRELECTQNPFYGLTEGCTIEARFYMPII